MKKILYTLPIILVLSMVSCDVIDSDNIFEPIENDTTVVDQKRVILLEEFTGNRCPNCPKAAIEAEKLMTMFPEQIVLIAIHAGFYAQPLPPLGYTEDFRTDVGNELLDYYGIQAFPKGVINRSQFNGSYALDHGEWEAVISELAQQNSVVDIKIDASYDATTRNTSVTVNTTTSEIDAANIKLCVYLTENNLICKQANGSEEVEDYPHDHVLRASFNGTWGENINLGKDSKNYNLTINENWNPDNCQVVAFVYRDDDKSVYQAFQVNLTR